MALKIMNARSALPSFLSEVFLPPFLPLRLLSLPRRLKSDQLSLYFSLSMAPATTSTHSHAMTVPLPVPSSNRSEEGARFFLD